MRCINAPRTGLGETLLVYDVARMRHAKRPHDEAYLQDVGDLIRRAREHRGLSQEQLADALGLSRSTMSRYEHGGQAFTIDLLPTIARELGLTRAAIANPPPKSRLVGSDLGPYLRPDEAAQDEAWAQGHGTLSAHPTDDDPDTSPGSPHDPPAQTSPRRRATD
jgi:transcriptional regulator with XRE-family HTH domain